MVGIVTLTVLQYMEMRKRIGIAFKKLCEDGEVKREDLFITSKLWLSDFAPEDVPVALDQTLPDLQLDYVDLYLMHWPVRRVKGSVGKDPETLLPLDIGSTWKAMEALFDSGKARAIGVSNFSSKKVGDLLNIARVPPAVNQVECHPSWQQHKLHDFCKTKGVHLSGYSPLGSPGKTHLKSVVIKHPLIVLIAEKLGRTPAQICLRWGLQMGHSVLPKSTTAARIKENFEVFDWSIPDDLFAKFSEIEQDVDVPDGFPFKIHDGPGRRTIVLERDYHLETIIVIVDFSKAGYEENVGSERGARDHDGKNEPELSLPMVVSISKGDPLVLQFEVKAFPEKMSIYGIRTVQPSETLQAYEGPAFLDLNNSLQEAFHKYLEARGITSGTAKFLLEYVIVKDEREYLRWLKKLKIFLSM